MAEMKFIAHDKPVMRSESNYIARIDLTSFDFPDVFEQIWLNLGGGEVGELCCIPFRAYGVSLRDAVRLSRDGSTVVEVVERSGRRVLRALLAAELGREQTRAESLKLVELIDEAALLSEWCGDREVAVDVPVGAEPAGLLTYFETGQREGRLHWEWGDTLPFSA